MDLDELFPAKPDDPLTQLTRQDLDPLSVDELHARIAVLEARLAAFGQRSRLRLTSAQAPKRYSRSEQAAAPGRCRVNRDPMRLLVEGPRRHDIRTKPPVTILARA
jgi:uncharacterized small protein (DUF1192 family)